MTWPDAIAPLAEQRGQAELCAAGLKRYGTPEQQTEGQIAYTKAKIESDALIAGLMTSIAARDTPDSLVSLQGRLASSAANLVVFC